MVRIIGSWAVPWGMLFMEIVTVIIDSENNRRMAWSRFCVILFVILISLLGCNYRAAHKNISSCLKPD
jgi:hypothetical protein